MHPGYVWSFLSFTNFALCRAGSHLLNPFRRDELHVDTSVCQVFRRCDIIVPPNVSARFPFFPSSPLSFWSVSGFVSPILHSAAARHKHLYLSLSGFLPSCIHLKYWVILFDSGILVSENKPSHSSLPLWLVSYSGLLSDVLEI
ncbi:hypothetical protein BO83DRAFT_8428 [Aspergillus eucalypticola CBS 122712]|uniref:Secreted protein n=1 Tax=Aspergillus eucalypticola (strain CBS 122712 / IBT 29274) TaxID=1448314 RepID=A0A317WK41_ASPEC|nr:uncharacterized protein BO83DRAFT_8428 [Aspergillus eucalypticola CBS 122712]PWY85438.1 hypothetical protein BO83DRAFT_8428 [Aspergillus eucalypticola CBS 122712]